MGTIDLWPWVGQAPFAIWISALLWAGLRRGWHFRPALLSTAALAAGLSIGAALLPSVLGAIAGGLFAWLAAQRLLGLWRPPLRVFALGLAALLSVGRLGCLFGGCCFGQPTLLPWAIHYAPGSPAFLLHSALGLVAKDAAHSLGVHPIPLYESLGLLLWLAAALRLRPRREATLLWLTGAVDLSLRAAIDGHRAMINVWWALVAPYRALLALAALLCLAAAWLCERRAATAPSGRRASVARRLAPGDQRLTSADQRLPSDDWGLASDASPKERGPARDAASWLIFAGIAATAVLCHSAQTPFLHLVLLLALLPAAAALRLPARAPAWAGPALASALLVPLLLRAQAVRELSLELPAQDERRWLYEVDHRRGLLVRVGNGFDARERLQEVHAALGLPEAKAEPRLWLGAGFAGGGARESHSGCGGPATIVDRSGFGGWVRAEGEIPQDDPAVSTFIGGRAGYFSETASLSGANSGEEWLHTGYGQAWLEREGPNLSLGVAVLAARLHGSSSPSGTAEQWVVYPGGHLRFGAPGFGLDLGFLDRQGNLGPPGGHVDFSGSFGPGAERLTSVRDVALRYHVGLSFAPGFYGMWQHRMGEADPIIPALGFGLEGRISEGLMLGADGAVGSAFSGGVWLRTTLGKR